MPTGIDDHYNNVFERLTDTTGNDAPDLQGLVAYGFYKSAKRSWVLGYKAENEKPPNRTALRAFDKTQVDQVLDAYRQQADAALYKYAASVVEEARPEIEKTALRGTGFKSFWASLAATITFAVVIAVLTLILAANDINFTEFFLPNDPG